MTTLGRECEPAFTAPASIVRAVNLRGRTDVTTDPRASVTLQSIDRALRLEDVYHNISFAG